MKKSLGIIGFGRFGQFAACHLKPHFRVSVSSRSDRRKEARKLGVEFTTMEECAGKDVVVLCVSISSFEEILRRIAPFLRPGALVADVCSVKEKPVKAMKEIIPAGCECIGTHPLFGPDSARDGLSGKKIALCPVRTKRLPQVRKLLKGLGLDVVLTTPEEHDRQMARSLALYHMLGRALIRTGVKREKLASPTHKRLMEIVDITKNDPEQLMVDMQVHNRFARKARKKLIRELERIDGELDEKL